MNILRNIDNIINLYLDAYNSGAIEKPDRCEKCGKRCGLSWHAWYPRKIRTLLREYEIPIKRLYCPLCRHTFALIPVFMEKFHRYAKDVIGFAVGELKKKVGMETIADIFMTAYELCVDVLTIYKWKKKFCNNI